MRTPQPREPRLVPFLATGAVLGAIILSIIARTSPTADGYSDTTISGYIVLLGAFLGAIVGGLVAAVISARNTRRRSPEAATLEADPAPDPTPEPAPEPGYESAD